MESPLRGQGVQPDRYCFSSSSSTSCYNYYYYCGFNAFELPFINFKHSAENGEKEDIYQLGIILLEVITGKLAQSPAEFNDMKLQVLDSFV